jgi:phenylpropionate dioxygenase-like ring-hydroxylating dioxygenase large terminal subunit
MTSEAGFAAEQQVLGQIWTFLGFDTDIPDAHDWFRTTLGGRSVFVQRLDSGELRGFLNRCAHRFYPLRTADRGNGPIICGYHHWRYDANGFAFGIPNCMEMFAKTPREINARLATVDIALCGHMIFGRFPGGPAESLQDWLGDGFAILEAQAFRPSSRYRYERRIAAHYKALMHISLDDYHIAAVHPETLGKQGYLAAEITRYFKFGAHSAFFHSGASDALDAMVKQCRDGSYVANGYKIFQFFPNLIAAQIDATTIGGDTYTFMFIQYFIPEAHDSTVSVTRIMRLPFTRPAGPWRRAMRALLLPGVTFGFRRSLARIHAEDNAAVARWQKGVAMIEGEQILAAQEERIGWFEEHYARLVTDRLPPL